MPLKKHQLSLITNFLILCTFVTVFVHSDYFWRVACQVNVAAVDHHGETALHLAIRGGSVDWYGATRFAAP